MSSISRLRMRPELRPPITSRDNLNTLDWRQRADQVPADYAEVFQMYYPYMLKLVKKFGMQPAAAEDTAMSILSKFLEKKALEHFDPDYNIEYRGETVKAAFRTYLSSFVVTYVKHHRHRQMVAMSRQGISLDTNLIKGASSYGDGTHLITVADSVLPPYEETYEELHTADLIRTIRAHLAELPRRNDQDKCDMLLFFDIIHLQVSETEKLNNEELAEMFDVSKPTILSWKKRLRVELSTILGAE